MRIDSIAKNLYQGQPGTKVSDGAGGAEPASFADELKSKLGEVNKLTNQADAAIQQSSIKGASNIHETMIQLEEANMAVLLVARVRDKALEAYQEVMRMQF